MAKLEAMLEQRGIASPREISEAIARCQLHGGDLTTSLLQFVSADETLLSATLSECYGLPAAGVGLLPAPDDAALRSLPREVAERYCCFPLETGPGRLVLAVSHPLEDSLLDELSLTLGVMIEERVALEVRIRQALARFYGLPLSARNQRGIARLEGDFEAAGHETPLGLWSDPQLSNLSRLPSDLPPSQRDSQRPPSVRPRSRSETPRYGNGPLPPSSGSRAGRRRGPMSLTKAREELGRTTTRNEVLDIFFAFASQFFEYSALFAVHNALAEGLDAWGKGADRDAVLGIGVPLDLPSSLSEAAESCKVRLTRLGKEGIDRTLMIDLQRQFNAKALVLPVSLRGRCAVLLYADNGEVDVVEREVADVIAIAGDVANALGRIILQRKKEVRQRVIDGLDLSGGLGDRRAPSAGGSRQLEVADGSAGEGGWSPSSSASSGGANGEQGEPPASVPGQRVVPIGGELDTRESRTSSTLPAAPFSLANDSPEPAPSGPRGDPGLGEDPVFLLARPQGKTGAQPVAPARSPFPTVQKPQVSITHPAPIIASRPRLPSVIVDPQIADTEATERAARASAVTRAPSQSRGAVGRRPAVPPPAEAPRTLSPSERDTRPAAVALAETSEAELELEEEVLDLGDEEEFAETVREEEAIGATASGAWPPPIMDNSPPPRQPPLTALVPIIIADPPKSKRGASAGVRPGAKSSVTRTGVQRTSSQPPSTGREPTAPTIPSPARARRVAASANLSGAHTPQPALDTSGARAPQPAPDRSSATMPAPQGRSVSSAEPPPNAAASSAASVASAVAGGAAAMAHGAGGEWRALSGDSSGVAARPTPAAHAASGLGTGKSSPSSASAAGNESSPTLGEAALAAAAAKPSSPPSAAASSNGALPARHGNALARAAARSSSAGHGNHPIAARPIEPRQGAGSQRDAGAVAMPPEPPQPPQDRASRPPLAAALAARVASSRPAAPNTAPNVASKPNPTIPSGSGNERSMTVADAAREARDVATTGQDAVPSPGDIAAPPADAAPLVPGVGATRPAHSADDGAAGPASTDSEASAQSTPSPALEARATASAEPVPSTDEDPASGERAASVLSAPPAAVPSPHASSTPGSSEPSAFGAKANGVAEHAANADSEAPTADADRSHHPKLANGRHSAFSISDRAPDSAEISDPLAWPDTPPPAVSPSLSSSLSTSTSPAPAGLSSVVPLSIAPGSILSRTSAASFDRAPDSAEISDPLGWPDSTPPSPVVGALAATAPLPAVDPESVAERPSAPPPSRIESPIPARPSRPPPSHVSNAIPTRPNGALPSSVANTIPSRAREPAPSSAMPTSPAGTSPGKGDRPAIFPPPPPPDGEIEELVERVCQGNLKAAQDLVRIGAPSLPRVMARFPGPVISERAGPSSRASECGPLLQALAAMGSTAMPTITQSSEHEDARVRRWATLLLGELPGPEACRAVVQRLADDEPRVHQAALDAARLLLAGPAADLFRTTLFEVAEADEAPLTLRLRTLEHVAKLKDSASVPRLLNFLAADVEPIVHKALWALTVVTRHDFGRDARAWTDFWEANRGRHRIEWLIDALDESDPRFRKAAAEELREEAGQSFGYAENLPRAERLEALAKFRAWWQTSGAARR